MLTRLNTRSSSQGRQWSPEQQQTKVPCESRPFLAVTDEVLGLQCTAMRAWFGVEWFGVEMVGLSVTALVVALGTSGCGGGTGKDALEGIWATSVPGKQCAFGFAFDSGVVEQDLICNLQSGGTGVDATIGTYTTSGNQLTVSSTRSSCPSDVRETATFSFSVQADTLTMTRPDGILVLKKVPKMPSSTGGAAVYGCFDDNLTFTSSPLRNL